MKITVLGCGALGQLWLSRLHNTGHQVQGWLREQVEEYHYSVVNLSGEKKRAWCRTNDAQFLAESQLLLVTLKAGQIPPVITPLLPLIAPECAIILLHNGMGVSEHLPSINQPLLSAITTQAAMRSHGDVIHTAQGITWLGALNQKAEHLQVLAGTLDQALPDVSWHTNIRIPAWHKLAANCAINPLSVYHHCRNGELLTRSRQVRTLCNEIAQVMRCEGVFVSDDSLFQQVIEVIHLTAANTCSMLQDVIARRTTEVEFITGYLRQQAALHGIVTPENDKLYQFVKEKERRYVK